MKKNRPSLPAEPAPQPTDEMSDSDLEQVAGGFDPQPDPPGETFSLKTNPSLVLTATPGGAPAAKKILPKIWGDPH